MGSTLLPSLWRYWSKSQSASRSSHLAGFHCPALNFLQQYIQGMLTHNLTSQAIFHPHSRVSTLQILSLPVPLPSLPPAVLQPGYTYFFNPSCSWSLSTRLKQRATAASAARHPKGSLAAALPVFTPPRRWRPRACSPPTAPCLPRASAVRTTLATAPAALRHPARLPGGCSFRARLSACPSLFSNWERVFVAL